MLVLEEATLTVFLVSYVFHGVVYSVFGGVRWICGGFVVFVDGFRCALQFLCPFQCFLVWFVVFCDV